MAGPGVGRIQQIRDHRRCPPPDAESAPLAEARGCAAVTAACRTIGKANIVKYDLVPLSDGDLLLSLVVED